MSDKNPFLKTKVTLEAKNDEPIVLEINGKIENSMLSLEAEIVSQPNKEPSFTNQIILSLFEQMLPHVRMQLTRLSKEEALSRLGVTEEDLIKMAIPVEKEEEESGIEDVPFVMMGKGGDA